jgi:hypothetical protein
MGISLLAALLLAAVGYFPTVWRAGETAIPAMLVAIGVSLFSSLVGAIPVVRAGRSDPTQIPIAVLASTAIRMGVVMALLVGLYFSKAFDPKILFIWTGISYFALLAVDVWFARRMTKANSDRTRVAENRA